ncbi:uncharacterized protein LOC118187955, partial [Stegodyphus dumicola]|uniref:uncharacterized protein LOC118187955 n=1 Tax=Stegodyphus dumicola TaxID=202533 RepID=UPI0015A94C12
MRKEYTKLIQDQLDDGIVEVYQNKDFESGYYMPHRTVMRPDKETSRVRIVVDASCKGKDSKSLNDLLQVGPNLNPNILDVILKFREHDIAFSVNIEHVFLMISIAEEDRKYLKIFWFQNDNSESLKIMNMTRLPFGISTSPFILAATIKHHIKKYITKYPESYEMLNSSLYVDDLYYGTTSVNDSLVKEKRSEALSFDDQLAMPGAAAEGQGDGEDSGSIVTFSEEVAAIGNLGMSSILDGD